MVLFKEDERRIREQERQEKLAKQTRLGLWAKRLFKIGLVLSVLFGVSLVLLSMLNGSNEALRKGIEDYLTQATGMRAEIQEFNAMSFFPDLALDAGDIVFRRDETGPPAMTVGTAKFSAGFFDLMFSRQRIEILTIENLNAQPGIWGDRALVLETLALQKDGFDGKPGLVLKGRYGENDMAALLAMDVWDKDGGRFVYKMPDKSDFTGHFGALEANGFMEKAPGGKLKLHVAALGSPKEPLSGDLLIRSGFGKKHVQADLTFGGSVLDAAVDLSEDAIQGTLAFPVLTVKDAGILRRFYGALTTAPGEAGPIGFGRRNVDVTVSVTDLRHGNGALGTVHLPMRVTGGILTAGPLGGTINGGALSGQAVVDASSEAATLDLTADLKAWDFGQYQKAVFGRDNVSGTANVKLAVKGEGKSWPALIRALDGEAAMVAGQGEFATAAINIWGGGIVRAMLPDLAPGSLTTLNCMIANFTIKDGIARPAPFFFDTARVTVVGDGTVNLPENRIAIKLEPKAKDPALLDMATAVDISGPILSPSIEADDFSVFEKLGGLALGVVNPAFLVFSLTDLGLTENHPCRKFIGEPGPENPAPKR